MNTAQIRLDEARRRVGTTMHVDPEWWAWTPGDVRWLAAQWRSTLPVVPPPPPPPCVWPSPVWPVTWRALLGVLALFVAALLMGWLG